MKVLVFTTQFHQLSGAERLAVELAEELNKRGIHADILAQGLEDRPGVPEAKEDLLKRGIPVVHFLGMKIHASVTSMIPTILKLRRLIRKERYDIVETSLRTPSIIASWATRGTRARHVAGLHDVFRKDRHNSRKDKFWRFSVRHNRDRFYAITDCAKSHWIEYSRTPPENSRTIYNAIPNDCFDAVPEREAVRSELQIPSEDKIALFVGRMLKRKGIDTNLDGLGPILHEANLHLVYVGGTDQGPEGFFAGEAGLLERMKEQIVCKGWTDKVHFLGRRSDVPHLMVSSDVLVHPARIEGFGLILAEAMAAGLPVVASNVQGIPEVLAGSDSIMVPPDDPEALRKAVLQTINRSPCEAVAAIEKGRKRAEDFRIGKRIDSMVSLFKDVLAGRL